MAAGVQLGGFVARYAAEGHLLWAKEIVGDANADVMGVAVAADDSFYVTGGFGGTTVFGKGETNDTTFTSVVSELFLAHYNADGTLAWVKRPLGSPPDGGVGFGMDSRNVALAPEGVLLVSGDFGNPAVFGPGEANQTAISPINYLYTDMFVASFDLTGELRWVRHVRASPATPNWMSSLGLAAVPVGGAAVTGEFEGPVTFGQGESNETPLVAGGAYAGVAARYEADGKLGWAKLFDSDGGEAEGYGISSVPGDCTLFVTGLLDNSGIFGIGETGATTLTADAGAGFVLRMQP